MCTQKHKENEPIRPVVNNIHAPAYKTAKYLNKKLNSLINLPQKMHRKWQKNSKQYTLMNT
jgi:hypothetical protein